MSHRESVVTDFEALKPEPALPVEAGLPLLERQGDLLLELCAEATKTLQASTSKFTPQEALQFGLVSAPVWLAHDALQGLSLCISKRLANPAHALSRTILEALINANYHLCRSPADAETTLKNELERLEADRNPSRPRPKRLEEPGPRGKIKLIRATGKGEAVGATLDGAYRFVYVEASHRLHADVRGSLSHATLSAPGLSGVWTHSHEMQQIILWLSASIEGTLNAIADHYAPNSGTRDRSRVCLEQLMALLPKET